MAEAEKDEPTVGSELAPVEGCPVRMWEGTPCGRPIHQAPQADSTPVCLMHSRDPGKSNEEFQKEFERILQAAGGGVANFMRFVFPTANYIKKGFGAKCDFSFATFTQGADFGGATFGKAEFFMAEFTRYANFRLATFAYYADFRNATFTDRADFFRAEFKRVADFRGARFLDRVEFRETKFPRDERIPGPVFTLTVFDQPEKVIFYKTYLGQALFHNCDVSKVVFSAVEWRLRKDSGKRMVFEELVNFFGDLKREIAWDLWSEAGSRDERNYGLIAELYQQLKKNYDDRRDYWTAGDFHYGEMEMKRLATPPAGWIARRVSRLNLRARRRAMRAVGRMRLDKTRNMFWAKRLPARIGLTRYQVSDFRRRWHQRLSLVAWYKYFSQYGESYVRPALWLLGVLLLFALFYPAVGLRYDTSREAQHATASAPNVVVLTYWQPFRPGAASATGKWSAWMWWLCGRVPWLCLFGHSFLTALYISALQKELMYEPVYPWGRLLALLQILLTSTLFALFVLALRRQFRR